MMRIETARGSGYQRVIALVCHRKQPIPTRVDAERLADSHIDCPKCQTGAVMAEYLCPTDPTHWHIGHRRP